MDTFSACEAAYRNGYDQGRIDAEKKEWINVKDRLPDKPGSYLVCTDRMAVCMAHFYKNGFSGGSIAKHIEYWMPKPVPPKEVE